MLLKDFMNSVVKNQTIVIQDSDLIDLYQGYCADYDNQEWFAARATYGYRKVRYITAVESMIIITVW